MTQKEIHEFLADTKVYVAGKSKEIQEKLFSLGYILFSDGCKEVSRTDKPFIFIDEKKFLSWSADMNCFSRKDSREISAEEILSLELTKPAYRPFKDREECWNEMLKHLPFGWLKFNESGNMAHIGCLYQSDNQTYITWSTNEDQKFSVDSVFKSYTFTDGTPFGIKEE